MLTLPPANTLLPYDRIQYITFMPTSMGDKSEKGTSLVVSSHSNIEKLHISDALPLISSALFCSAVSTKMIYTSYRAC